MTKYVILIPCFNDWDSLNFLIPQIDKAIQDINESIDTMKVIDIIKNVMENAHKPVLNLSVPLIVDANFGKNWDEAH